MTHADLMFEKSTVLDKEVHHRIVQNIDAICDTAGIPAVCLATSMVGHCSEDEIKYFREYREHAGANTTGLVYLGKYFDPPVSFRMQLMAGAFLRNFVNARVMSLRAVLDEIKAGERLRVSVLMIPNFCYSDGGTVAEWELGGLTSLLLDRQGRGLQTIIGVESPETLKAYGTTIHSLVDTGYLTIDPA